MKRFIKAISVASAVVAITACTQAEVAKAIGDLEALNNVCVTGFKATWKPRVQGAFTDSVDFQVTFTNPLPEDAHGSIQALVYVRANNVELGSPASNVDAQSAPDFGTPVTAIYPANTPNGYTSAVAVKVPWTLRTFYNIEVKTNIPGSPWDGKPCHHFQQNDIRVAGG